MPRVPPSPFCSNRDRDQGDFDLIQRLLLSKPRHPPLLVRLLRAAMRLFS